MDYVQSQALAATPTSGNVSDHVEENARLFPSAPVLSRQVDKQWVDVTAVEFREIVRGVAKGLMASGIEFGSHIGIFSRTRFEWTIADYAIWYAGCVPVPIYETSSSEQVQWIMSDAHVVATFFEAPRTVHPFTQVQDQLPHMQHTFVFSLGALDDLIAKGHDISDAELDARRTRVTPQDLATIIYTSGTTGKPKGCMLTHSNFMAESDNLIAGLPEVFLLPGASTLLFLPLAHVFGRMIEVAMLRARVTIGHCPSPASLLNDLAVFKPTFILAVPRVFERVFNSSRAKAHKAGARSGKIFDQATAQAIKYSESLDSGKVSLSLRLQHKLFDALVYSKIRSAMGGRVQYAISGGASLGTRLGHYYRGLGLIVLEGYGLTETTAGSTLNIPKALKIGSVGRPVFGTEVRLAADGEIELRGHNVFAGYWNNSDATQAVMNADGWFVTGDLGRLDDDGYLYITGRKKEILVTTGGKNVAPAVLEDRLRANPLISQCVVVGDNRPYIGALITIDMDAAPAILEAHGLATMSLEHMATDPHVRELLQEAVNTANEAVSNSEAIKKFAVLATDFTIDNGYLTPKMSIKRHLVTQDFAQEIESLYV